LRFREAPQDHVRRHATVRLRGTPPEPVARWDTAVVALRALRGAGRPEEALALIESGTLQADEEPLETQRARCRTALGGT
jgi:hypothetical protein